MWNTWDVRAVNVIVNLEDNSGVTLGLYDGLSMRSTFTWRDGVGRLGEHTADGHHAQTSLQHDPLRISVEYGVDAEHLVCHIIPFGAINSLSLAVRVDLDGREAALQTDSDGQVHIPVSFSCDASLRWIS